ncbi:phage tail tape measure protein [Deinococcus radiomollis]|uniref:phage tail tape measure protein n=1 Tax=Deinococcus radiomollis TaxID=468916 RepID=UPI0038915901
MMENTVSYALHATTTGVQDLKMFREELTALRDLQGGFRSDMGFGTQQRESIKATSVDLSGLEFQILGLTDSIKVLDTTMGKLGQSSTGAGQKTKAAFVGVDPTIAETVRTVRTLLTEFQNGNIKAGEFGAGMQKAKAELIAMSTQNSLGTRELQVISAALNIVAKSYGEANTASSPYLAGLKAQKLASQESRAAAVELNQQVMQTRRLWQEEKIDNDQLAQAMKGFQAQAERMIAPLVAQREALAALGVPTKEQATQMRALTTEIERYSLASQRAGAGVNAAAGKITRGSLAAGVRDGTVAALEAEQAALKASTAETDRLVNAEKARIITKKQLNTALLGQVDSQKAALLGIESEMAGLKNLSSMDVQQVERLAQLTRAQGEYTAAIARTVGAQERSAGIGAKGAFMGGAGLKAGLNDAGMALSFISPQAGMLGMMAGSGPIVAGAAAIGLGIAGIVKLTKDGQDEAKKLQAAYLSLQVNGVQDIKAVDTALNQMVQTGSTSDKMFSKAELAGALAQLSRSGFKGAEGIAALSSATRLAASENIPLSEATKNLAANLQHLEMTGTQAATFGDKLVRASHLTQDSANDFSKGMNVIGFTALKLGYSVDETMGMLVALSKKGLDPATIGATGLRNAMQLVEHPSKKAAAAMAELGVATVDSAGHARTGRDIFMDLMNTVSASGPVYSKTTGHLMTENDRAALNFILFGTRSATAFIGVQHGAKEAADDISKSQGFMTEASDKTASSLENTQKRQTAALKNLASAFAKSFTGILTEAATGIANFLTAITPTMNKISDFFDMLNKAHTFREITTTLKINAGDGFTLSAVKLLTEGGMIAGAAGGFVSKAIGQEISGEMLQIELLKREILKPSLIPIVGPLTQLNMIKDNMAYYIKAVNDYDAKHVGNAAPSLFMPGDARGLAIPTTAKGNLGAANANVLGATLSPTNNTEADNLIGWCARWVKLTLEKAQPGAKAEIDKWFGGDANDVRTRLMANKRLDSFNGDPKSLNPGDVVVYNKDGSGNGHIGVYIGMVNDEPTVRGNNEWGVKNGRGVVSDENLFTLGGKTGIAGIVRAAAAASGFTGMAPSIAPAVAPTKAPPEMDPNFKGSSLTSLKALKDEMLRLTAAYKSGKMDVDAYHTAVQGVLSQAEALAATQKTGSKEWTATEQLVIKASNALKVHTKATEQSALTWAQWLKNRSAATALAQRESDLSDGKLSPQAAIQTKADLQSYRNDPVKALALEEASRQLAASVKRREEAQRVSDQSKKDADAQAKQALADQKQQEKDRLAQQKEADGITQSLRTQDVEKAQGHLDALKLLRDNALKDAGDNVVKQLAVQKKYAADLQAGAEAIANAQFKIDKAAALSGPSQLRDGAMIVAKQKLEAALAAAGSTDSVDTATQKHTDAVVKQRDAYSKLADSMRGMVKDGSLTAESLQSWLKDFNDLGRETETLGLTNDRYVKGARVTTFALKDQGIAAQGAAVQARAAAGEFKDVTDGAGQATVGFTASLADLEAIFPTSADGADGFSKALDEMAAAGNISNETLKTMKLRLDDLKQNGFNNGLIQELAAGGAYANISDGGRNPSGTDFQTLDPTQQNKSSYDAASFSGFTDSLSRADFDGFIKGANLSEEAVTALTASWKTFNDAVNKTLDDVNAHPGLYADGAQGLVTAPESPDSILARQAKARADQQGRTSAGYSLSSAELDAQHSQGLIQEADYLKRRYTLDRDAAVQELLNADQDGKDHVTSLAQYRAKMLSIETAYLTGTKTLNDKTLKDSEAMQLQILAGQASSAQATLKTSRDALDIQHAQGLVSDRVFQASREMQDLAALDANFQTSKISLEDYENEYTRIKAQGVKDRLALDKAGLDSFIQGIDSLGSALGGMSTLAGAALTTLGGVAKLSQSIPDLLKQTQSAFSPSGSIFDKLGAAGGWLGAISTGIGLIGQLGDALFNLNPASAAAKKALLDFAQTETSAMGSKSYGNLINPYYDRLKTDADARTSTANASIWQKVGWWLFGGAPKLLDQAAADSLVKSSNLFSDYAQAINQSLETELMNAFDSADFTQVQSSLDRMFGKLEASIALKALISKSNLGRDIQKLVDDTTAGLDTTADKAAIKGDERTVTSQFQAIAPAFDGYGATAATNSTTGSGGTTFGSVPQAVQLAMPTQFMDAAALYDTATRRFDGSTIRFEETAARIDATIVRFESAMSRGAAAPSTGPLR